MISWQVVLNLSDITEIVILDFYSLGCPQKEVEMGSKKGLDTSLEKMYPAPSFLFLRLQGIATGT